MLFGDIDNALNAEDLAKFSYEVHANAEAK